MPVPFISRDDLTDSLGIDVTNDDGAIIALDAACDAIRTMTEQDINFASSTITLDGTGTDALVLPQFPAANAGTVVVAGGTISDYVLDTANGVLIRRGTLGQADSPLSSPLTTWPYGRQNVQVTYDHGYTNDNIPRDLRVVALNLAQRLIVQGPALQEQSGQQSVRYAVASDDFTKGELIILRKYRRR